MNLLLTLLLNYEILKSTNFDGVNRHVEKSFELWRVRIENHDGVDSSPLEHVGNKLAGDGHSITILLVGFAIKVEGHHHSDGFD